MRPILTPRCSKCGAPGLFTPSWSPGSSLCAEHFIEAVRSRVERIFSRSMRGVRLEKVVAGVSGGKDSVAMLDILAWLGERHGFEVIGVYINLGIPRYSSHAERVAIRAFNEIGVDYLVVDAREVIGVDTRLAHEASRRRITQKPTCAVCGMIKRRVLESVADAVGADAIATGHTFDDIFAFSLKNISSGYSERFGVVEIGSRIVRLKPLIVIRESDTLAYVIARRLPFTETPCPYKPRNPVDRVYKLVAGYLSDANQGLAYRLALIQEYVSKPRLGGRCIYCGAPSESMVCSACRLFSKILREMAEG